VRLAGGRVMCQTILALSHGKFSSGFEQVSSPELHSRSPIFTSLDASSCIHPPLAMLSLTTRDLSSLAPVRWSPWQSSSSKNGPLLNRPTKKSVPHDVADEWSLSSLTCIISHVERKMNRNQ